MPASMLDRLSALVTPEVVGQASVALDEPAFAINRAMSATLPVLLKGLSLGVRQPRCRHAIYALAVHKNNDARQLGNIGELFTTSAATTLALGERMLHALFGNNIGLVAEEIADYGAVRPSSARTMLTAAAQMILADLDQKMRSPQRQRTPAAMTALVLHDTDGFDSSGGFADWGMARRFGGTADAAAATTVGAKAFDNVRIMTGRAAATLASASSSASPQARTTAAAGTVKTSAHAAHRSHSSFWSWIALATICCLGGAFALINLSSIQAWWWGVSDAHIGGQQVAPSRSGSLAVPTSIAPRATSSRAPDPADTGRPVLARPAAEGARGAPLPHTTVTGPAARVLPRGERLQLNVADDSVEARVIRYIEDTRPLSPLDWFELDRITFDTASNALTTQSMVQVLNIAAILTAYPSVKLKIGGYTDNIGDPAANLRLSDARANTVMQELINLGIAPDRLTAEGYGEEHPVADNSTSEGRGKNRRIAFRVTQR